MIKTIDGNEYDEKVQALAIHLQDTSDEGLDFAKLQIEDGDYDVLTDEEADDKWDEELDNYIDECIMPEFDRHLPNMYCYFDDEAWKRDARYDGRGHSLSRYDGEENEEEVDGVIYYIYRQN